MNIALLTDGIYPHVLGGMQTHSFYLAKYFAQNKIDVDLYHPIVNMNEGSFSDCFSIDEAKYIHPVFVEFPKSTYYPGHYISESYAYSKNIYLKYLKNKKPDFIYAQGFTGWELIKQKKQSENSIAPIGVNFHGLNMFQPAFGLKNRLNNVLFKPPVKFNLKYADCIFSLGGNLSSLIRQNVKGVKKIIEIPVGIDNKWLIQEPEIKNCNLISFVFIGRYDKVKGIDLLNKAIQHLANKNIPFEFNFIGPFPFEKQLKYSTIKYHGEIRDTSTLKHIIQKCDVIVSSSYSEGMPTVILEAMACGLAVIATNVGAVVELVNAENGRVISSGSVERLEEAMFEFIQMDKEQLLEMKKHSLKKVKSRFLWDKIITQTIAEIKAIIE